MTILSDELMRQVPETPVPIDQIFDAQYGLKITELTTERVLAIVPVTDRARQPAGLVHGGVYSTMAETMASWGTMAAVLSEGKQAVGHSVHSSFLRPIRDGTVHAVATRRHAGRRLWLWDVEVTDDAGRPCALCRVSVAVVEAGPA